MTKEPRFAVQFSTRKAAAAHAALIGWPISDAHPMEYRGFRLWTLMDHHCSMLTWAGFTALLLARDLPDIPTCFCLAHVALREASRVS